MYPVVMMLRRKEVVDVGLGGSVLALAMVFSLISALGPAPGQAGTPVLIIAPPWGDGADTMALQAGGALVGPYQARFGALAIFDGMAPVQRLISLGAWSVRDGRVMASLCGVWKE